MAIHKSVNFDVVYTRRIGDKIIVDVDVRDLDGSTLHSVPAHYDVKTGRCGCNFLSHLLNVPNKPFEGEDRTCEHYPNGNCEIVTEEIIKKWTNP